MSSDYDRKFDEMKKYIPFLESMIKRLESTSGKSTNPRLAQLDKIRSLRDLLLDKKKRMKMENLLKCEQVLINLYAKVEQRDVLPGIKKKSDSIFDIDSPTSKEKTDLDSVRNKIKVVSKQQEEGTLPEIARANQIEETTIGKEPALFQRRPNKSPSRHPPNTYTDTKVSLCNNQNTKRNYTRVLVSPETSPSRRQTTESPNKLLYKRRSPKKSSRDYSPSHHKRDRKKISKREGTFRKVKDFNITLNVPEESLESLNTDDILSRIINCNDNDVDIDTLRELRSQILGELKETGTNNDISDLLLKSYKQNKKNTKPKMEIEEGEISDSESEAIESIYGSLVVVDKDIKAGNEPKKLPKSDAPRKIQICLVINSDKESDIIRIEDNSVDISDFDLSDKEPKPSSCVRNKEVSKMEALDNNTNINNVSVNSDSGANKRQGIEVIEIDTEDKSGSQLQGDTGEKNTPLKTKENGTNILNSEGKSTKIDDIKLVDRILNENINKNNAEIISENDKNTVQFRANFYKPLNDEEPIDTNNDIVSKTDDKKNEIKIVEIPPTKDETVKSSTTLKSTILKLDKPLDSEKNVDIPLLNESSVPKKPEEKTIVSEIDILQALKNEILSETIGIPGTDTTTPPLHQPKLTKVASAKEIMPKKRISIEKYKEKSVTTTVKNMLKKDNENDIALPKSESIKQTKIKLTEKECERFNLPARLSLDDEITSDDEDGYNSDILIEDVYGDLAPKSPDDTSAKEMNISPPVIIPADPIKESISAPKADIDMRTLPPLVSPNPSIGSNSSNVMEERNKELTNDNSRLQTSNKPIVTKRLPLDPRIRKELLKKDILNANSTPERISRPTLLSTPAMTPIMTPNSRSYEMTPTHHSFEVDIPSKSKHVYAPFASSFDIYDNRERSLSRETSALWDRTIPPEEKNFRWEENRDHNLDLREPYQVKKREESNYRKGKARIERYKIDRRDEYRPDSSSTPGPAFGRSDNSATFCRMESPVVDFGRLDCVSTPSHTFGRSDCPATPSHPFGRTDAFERHDLSVGTHRIFGRSDYPTTPNHPFGRSDGSATPSHPFGRSDGSATPSHSYGRSDCPATPSHPFGRADCPSTPSHSFGRPDCPTTPSYSFGSWKNSDYDDGKENSTCRDRSYDRKSIYVSQNRHSDTYRRDSRNDQDDDNRYADHGRNYNKDQWSENRSSVERPRIRDDIPRNYTDKRGGYDNSSRSSEDFRTTHKSREQSTNRYIRDDPRNRERITSVGRNNHSEVQTNKMLSVQPEAGRSFKIDTSVNTTFQNFIVSKGLESINENFDARRTRAASVGRSLQRESSVGRVIGPKPAVQIVTFSCNNKDRYKRASSVGRECATAKSTRSLKDLKADFEAFKESIKFNVSKPVNTKEDKHCPISNRRSRWDVNEQSKNRRKTYSPTKNTRDPRTRQHEHTIFNKIFNKRVTSGESHHKNRHGIIYSSDNIANGTVLGSGSGVRNYKIPKLRSVIEEKERLKREKEEKERKEKEKREQELREKKEKEKREREDRLRLEKEENERKQKEEKEKKENLERERKEKLENERKKRLEIDNIVKERLETERIEKERLESDKIEKSKCEKERKEHQELEREEKEREKLEGEQNKHKKKEERDRQELTKQEELEHKEIQRRENRENITQENDINEETPRVDIGINDSEKKESHTDHKLEYDKEQLGQTTNNERKIKICDEENNDPDSPTKRITRSRAKMANYSSDEITPKKLMKAFDFESDSENEIDVSLKKISTKATLKKCDHTSPVNNKQTTNKNLDFQSTFEVDELFGENVASDPVIDNINALIADLDNDIDTSKTDTTETFKNEISLENMLENITSSHEGEFKVSNQIYTDVTDRNTVSAEKNQEILKKDGQKDTQGKTMTNNLNMENIVTTSEVPSEIKVCEKAKISDSFDDRSNDGCSTPDSTIINDAVLERPKELSIKGHSNESNSDVTSTLDTVESSVKDNVEPSSSHKDLSSLGSIESILTILQDKSKIKELLSMLSDSDNEKMKKKLEKLSELVSDDDEDPNDTPDNKDNIETQNKSSLLNSDIDKYANAGNENNNDEDIRGSAMSMNNYISGESLKEIAHTQDIEENNKGKLDEKANHISKKTNMVDGLKENRAQDESNTDSLETSENMPVQDAKVENIDQSKKKVPPKNSRGKFVKKVTKKEVVKNQNNKPKRKRNELQKLQQDIKEMFEREDILNSTGIRMCRIAKMIDKDAQQKDETLFQDPKPVVVLNKYLDSEKPDVTTSVKIRKKPGPKPKQKLVVDDSKLKNVMQKPGPKSKTKPLRKEDSDPYAFETDSISESTKTMESETESDTSDSENCSLASSSKSFSSNEVLLDIKKKRRKRGSWKTGVIRPKNKKKAVEQKHDDKTDDIMLPPRDIPIPDLNCFIDKSYCFQKKLDTYSCRLCVYTGADIILHYKQKHPHTEIPLSRISSKMAKESIQQTEKIDFNAFSKIPSKSYTCKFCLKEFVKSQAVLEKFFWHVVSMHTGEYKQSCSECDDATQCPFNLDIPPPPKDLNGQLIGYICERCNFTQISLENLKTHVIVRHNDEQTVVYTINLSVMTKKKLNSFIRRCRATNSRSLRSNRSVINSITETSEDQSNILESECDTTPEKKPSLNNSPEEPNKLVFSNQIRSKITFESEDTNTEQNDVPIKIETEQLNIPNNMSNDVTEKDTALEDLAAEITETNDDPENLSDITAVAHFKISYKENGAMEYVCCINGDAHFRTVKLISIKQHARKHTELWDGYCILCKVIVTPQGAHKFHDCLQHFIDIHMEEFPVLERVPPSDVDQTPALVDTTPPKPYINVRPLSDLISKPIQELIPEQPASSPIIESVVSLTQSIEPARASPSYPSTSLEKSPEKEVKYEEWQALVMSKKHRVVLATMMSKGNLIKVFKCAGRFCSFTSDNAEEALLHASTHQRIGGEGAMNCAYCDFDTSDNAIDLVMHVFKAHGRCQYACALCFYRAAASQLVGAHIANAHSEFTAEGNVLRTTSITAAVPEDVNVLPRDKAVPYYVCAQQDNEGNQYLPPCKFRTYAPGKFCEHLTNVHKTPYCCAECRESFPSSTDLIVHMKGHGFRLYQCTWCVHGAEKEADLIAHVASKHPDKQPQAYIRIITNKDGSSEYRVLPLAYLNKSKVPTEDVTPSKTDDPIREADRSLELEKLIGQTTLLLNNTTVVQEKSPVDIQSSMLETIEAQEIPTEPDQPSSLLQTAFSSPLSVASDSLLPRNTHSPSIQVSSESISTSIPTQSSPLPITNITTPSLIVSTITVPTRSIMTPSSVSSVEEPSAMTPVIKVEPLEPSVQSADVIVSESDDDVIHLSDDEPETEKTNEIAKDMLLKCPGCKAVYIALSSFMKHVIENGHAVGSIVCPHSPCQRSVNTLKDLIDHYQQDHVSLNLKSKKTKFRCALCVLRFHSLDETKIHLKDSHNITKIRVIAPKNKDEYVVSECPSAQAEGDRDKTLMQEKKTEVQATVVKPSVEAAQSSITELATITALQNVPVSTSGQNPSVPIVTSGQNQLVPMGTSGENKDQTVTQVPKVEPKELSVDDVVLCDSDDEPTQSDIINLSDDETPVYTPIDNYNVLKCPKCLTVFKFMSVLLRHMSYSKHVVYPVKCPHAPCTKVLDGMTEMRQHYQLDHKAGKVVEQMSVQISQEKKASFTCDICKAVLSTYLLAKKHMKEAHSRGMQLRGKKKNATVCSEVVNDQPVRTKNTKEVAKLVYSPEEIDLLPIKPILDKSVRCSLCKFNTKVRLNMVRHLQLHLNQQHVPQTAPVNPVPHLETNEKHFDKMVNLASSSVLTRPEKQVRPENPTVAVMIPPESAAKYPKYVPDRQRLTCGAKGCSYISVDEAMLKCHWETLHSGTNEYHCVHCPPYQHLDKTRELTAVRVITHLRMHDVMLYACSACPYYHYMKSIVEKHLRDVHNGGNVLIVREEAPSAAPVQPASAPTMDLKPWQCGLCKFKTMLHPCVVEHCSKLHNSKMQFKCGYCPFRTSMLENVTKHQANSHPGKAENVFYYYYREGSIPDEPDGTPRWLKQRQKMPEHVVKTEIPDGTLSETSPTPVANPPQLTVDLNRVKKETEEESNVEMSIQELCKRYGEFCEPNGLRYKCSLCKVVFLDSREEMESHLYEELHYRKWVCGLCSYKAFHLTGLTDHMAAEHGPKRQEAIQLPVDGNLERWVQAYLDHQAQYIGNSKKSLDELKQAAAKAIDIVVSAQKPAEAPSQYSHEELIKAFGEFGAASEGKYCCPKCDFVSTEYDVIKGHLEGELGKIRAIQTEVVADVYQQKQQTQLHIQSSQTRPHSNAERQRRYREKRKAYKMNACTTFSQSSDDQLNQQEQQHDVQINKRQPQTNAERQRKYRKLLREQRQQQQKMEDINATTVMINTSSNHQLQNVDQGEHARKRYLNKLRQSRYRARQRFEWSSTSSHQAHAESWTCSSCSEYFLTYHQAQYHCKSAHPTVPSRPNPAARQQDLRTAWINAVIETQKQAMTLTAANNKNDFLDQSDNSLLVVRYEESVTDQEEQQNRKRPASSDSEEDNLVIDEPERKKRGKNYKCRYCTCVVTNTYNLNYHQLRHFNLFPLSCSYCSFTGMKQTLMNHIATVHPSLPVVFKQTVLPDGPPPMNVKLQNKRSRDDIICLSCEQPMNLTASLNHKHDDAKPEFSMVGSFVMKCSICHMLCANAVSLADHHDAAHQGVPMSTGIVHEMTVTRQPMCCSVCSKEFVTRKDLYNHERTEHANDVTSIEDVAPSPKRVARKSTTKLPRSHAVARKSTTKLPHSTEIEEYSFYGTKPSMNEYDNVTTLMPFCNTIMSFTVKKLNEIININPRICVEDVNKGKK